MKFIVVQKDSVNSFSARKIEKQGELLHEKSDETICGAFCVFVPFAQFKKREKHLWRNVTVSKVTLLHGCFLPFLNCANGTKLRKAPFIYLFYFLFLANVPLNFNTY